ncbi:TPA: enoyl-[acyl-carrier-protein] reductase FabK, partial [Streptococcus suis]
DTTVSASVVGHSVRAIKNKLSTAYAAAEKDFLAGKISAESIEELGAGALRNAVVDGDVVNGSVMAGQIAGLVTKEETCEEILKDLYFGAAKVIREEANRWASVGE